MPGDIDTGGQAATERYLRTLIQIKSAQSVAV